MSQTAGIWVLCGRKDDAENLLWRALGMVRNQPGPERAELLAYIGTVRLRNGDHKHAERMLRESLELQRQSSGAADANSEIFTLQNLG